MTAVPQSTPPLVAARNVQKAYGAVNVLSDVSFDIFPGITGLLGSNGAGKTTMLGMILGLHPVDAGTLLVNGKDPGAAGPEIRALVGYAPEHHTLPPTLQADDFVRHVAELHGLPPTEAATRSNDALWLVGLGEERFRPLGTMSTGQRQRVKLAQAIAHDPQLVLLDEPTDGLDPVQRDAMLELIKHISTEFGINIVVSSHLLDEVEQVCTGIVILSEGRTLTWGRLDELQLQGQSGIVLQVDGSEEKTQALASYLQGVGCTVWIQGPRLQIDAAGDVFDLVRDAVIDHQLGIVRLSRQKLSLEDVFMESLG